MSSIEIQESFFKNRISSKYREYLALRKEVEKTNNAIKTAQKNISESLDKYKEKGLESHVYRDQFLNINYKLRGLLNDIAFIKTDIYFHSKIADELMDEIELPAEIQDLIYDTEKELYKPYYAEIEGKITEINPQRKEEFVKMFDNEEIKKEMEKLTSKFEDQ